MLYLLVTWLRHIEVNISGIRVLQYITVRATLAIIMSFVIGVLIGPGVIRWLHDLKYGQQIRVITEGVPLHERHEKRKGTPTMGGIIIITALVIPVLLFCNLTNPLVLMLLAVTIGFGLVGYRDDYLKITKQNSKGLSPRKKMICQIILGSLVGLFLKFKGQDIVYAFTSEAGGTHVCFPFVKSWYPDLGWLFIPYAVFVITATSNAVNLTDGLDGLAIGTVIIATATFGVIAYLAGRPDFSRYLMIPFVPGGGEVAVFIAAILGASAAFLWYNANTAMVFMGDTGSLALGGLIGTIALFIKQDLLVLIIGGIFVIEALSVVIQVFCYRRWGKRPFLMAPIHHHFEKLGWPEPRIITRFWIVAAIFALIGLTTLKLR